MDAHESWRHEKESAWLYRVLAESEPIAAHRALFAKLAEIAEAQAAIWASNTPERDTFEPSLRVRLVAALARRLGARHMRGVLAAMKVRGLSVLAGPAPAHAMPRSIDEVGARHRSAKSSGGLRAAVFGANDGLVSNASLLLGIAGATEIIVGNPVIADVAVQSGNLLVITGKSFGITNLIALDAKRQIIFDRRILVKRDDVRVINLQRGAMRQTFNCTPQCNPTVTIGDDPTYFEAMVKAAEKKSGMSEKAADGQGNNTQ